MTAQRIDLVVIGQVAVSVTPAGVERAGAIGVADGRVVLVGDAATVREAAPGARVIEAPDAAVVPGLHDFHLHLVGMARQRHEVQLDGLDGDAVVRQVGAAAERAGRVGWLRGRGWSEAAFGPGVQRSLNVVLAELPAILYSHDGHSSWASPAALSRAGVGAGADDPPGGRIERGADGTPTGVLREAATDLVEAAVGRLRGPELGRALRDVVRELNAWGITAATDAGDTAPENGSGPYAALGDRASALLEATDVIDARLRLAVGFPADAIHAAADLGLATGAGLSDAGTIVGGWAKAYADGALGSRTAAIFEPYTCAPGDTGILRLTPERLADLLAAGADRGIRLAIHSIGDRAVAAVLDALERARKPGGGPPHRIEHLQLMRADDRARLARLGVTASVQPIHCAADRAHVEECWADRAELAYPFGSLLGAGARLAFGSDAPIESPNPWLGAFAAVHRRLPHDGTPDWQVHEGVSPAAALAGYTSGAAAAAGRSRAGHLREGADADLAVLSVTLDTLLAADERLAGVRSLLTLVAGREVHR
ncbi:MAG TPA: amidohydrolase, partial [Candidatus Limnocylindria bacterium]|nr:amidohydrolase [Candidatus Limnocylindria bacterium]